MLASKSEYLNEASNTIFQLSADEQIRKRCRDREEYYQDLRDYEKAIAENDAHFKKVIAEKDAHFEKTVAKKDAIIAEKDAIIERTVAEKNASIAEKDASIAEKDASIAEKDALIRELLIENEQLKNKR